jgi:hypothetical protein
MFHPEQRVDVVEDAATARDSVIGVQVAATSVDTDYFAVLGAQLLAGRAFHAADLESNNRVVIVNRSFVERVLRGENALGRRLRFIQFQERSEAPAEPTPTYEIVGVVQDLGMNYLGATSGYAGAGLYHPLAGAHPVYMAVKVTGDPASHATRLQAIANSVDPSLRLYDLQRLDQLDRGGLVMFAIYLRVALLLSAVALLLSLAGIYAVMSFTVSRRIREIGIRVALGADPRRIVLTIFRRPLTQVSLGILAGGGLSALLAFRVIGSGLTPRNGALLLGYAALMMGVCMLACILPTRRALRVHPTDALREDG